jgi:hypothetical protein
LVIHEGETLAEVKVRVQKKLQVPDEEFSKVFSSWCLLSYCHTLAQTCRVLSPCLLLNVISFFLPYFVVSFQWKFAFLSLGRPEYLQDSDIVSSRFQVCLTALSLSLSLSLNMPTVVSLFLLATYHFVEKGCLWCLGAVSWVGTHGQRT